MKYLNFAFSEELDPVAVYAAIVSTTVLIWQIFVWFRGGPRIKLGAGVNMKMFGGIPDNRTYVIVNVSNVGNQATTITHVVGYTYNKGWRALRRKPTDTFFVNQHPSNPYPLPYLEPGRAFMSLVNQDEKLEAMSRDKRMLELFTSCTAVQSLHACTRSRSEAGTQNAMPRDRKPASTATPLTYTAWKDAAAADLIERHGIRTNVREKTWRDLYIRKLSPAEAADRAAADDESDNASAR